MDKQKDLKKEITEEFGKGWQDEQKEKMVRIQFPTTIKRIEERVRLEERKKTLEEVWEVFGEDMRIQIEEIGWCEDKHLTKDAIELKKKILPFVKNNKEILSKLLKEGNNI